MSTALLVIFVAIGVAFFSFLIYVFSKNLRKPAISFSRMVLGLVFIFSGFVKAVDPLGSMYKFQDYFLAFGMDFMIPSALVLGFLLFTLEFIIGFAFFFNIRMKLFSWLMLLFMVFFFILTFVLALTNPVSDCGCFGDALILTNWETFYKNIALMIFTVMVFAYRNKMQNRFPMITQNGLLIIGFLIVLGASVYSYRYLPLIDFMHWKVGTKISDKVVDTPEIADIKLVYKNTETGEMLEYTSKTLPWQDTVFFKKLQFVEQKKTVIQEYKQAPIHDFMLDDENKVNHNEAIIKNPNFQFLLISYNLDKVEKSIFEEINTFYELCKQDTVSFVCLCGADWESINTFKKDNQIEYDFYGVDATALKAVVRANPGLVLLKNGVVVDKWAWRCIPSYEKFVEDIPTYNALVESIATGDTLAK